MRAYELLKIQSGPNDGYIIVNARSLICVYATGWSVLSYFFINFYPVIAHH